MNVKTLQVYILFKIPSPFCGQKVVMIIFFLLIRLNNFEGAMQGKCFEELLKHFNSFTSSWEYLNIMKYGGSISYIFLSKLGKLLLL